MKIPLSPILACLVLCSSLSAAQQTMPSKRAVTPVHLGTYKVGSNEFIPNSASTRSGPDVLYNNNLATGYYSVPGADQEWIDEGGLQDRGDLQLTQINGFEFSYCSTEPDPTQNSGGFTINFYREHQICQLPAGDGYPDGSDCTYDLIGLPLGTANGGIQCWVVNVDLSGGFECSGDQAFYFPTEDAAGVNRLFGWGFIPHQDNTGPFLAHGGHRNDNSFVWWDAATQQLIGCFWFGGWPVASFAMRILGPPPNVFEYGPDEPDVNDTLRLLSDPAVAGGMGHWWIENPNPGRWYWFMATLDWNQSPALGGTLLVDYPNLLPPTPLQMPGGDLTVPLPPVLPDEFHTQAVETNAPNLSPSTVTAFSTSTKNSNWKPQNKSCSVTSFTVPKNKTACKVVDAGSGRKKVGQEFLMEARFGATNPECCEYRQYLKGEFKVGGTVLTHNLPGGKKLEKNKYHEDGIRGATPPTNEHYGHRSEGDQDTTDVYSNPDRATGKNYDGYDFPGITGTPPFTYSIDLVFKGEIIDVCKCNKVVKSSTWKVKCSGTVNQPEPAQIGLRQLTLEVDNVPVTIQFSLRENREMRAIVSFPSGPESLVLDASQVDLQLQGHTPLSSPAGPLLQTVLREFANSHAFYNFDWPENLDGQWVQGTIAVLGSEPVPFQIQL
ncbi:MAG: hypothetical protein DWQ01_17250 [Planctomycetota bacterium]|nr:MAG: hypothetical protein DWQ01_17250 [Planctomycetota bacterium]